MMMMMMVMMMIEIYIDHFMCFNEVRHFVFCTDPPTTKATGKPKAIKAGCGPLASNG